MRCSRSRARTRQLGHRCRRGIIHRCAGSSGRGRRGWLLRRDDDLFLLRGWCHRWFDGDGWCHSCGGGRNHRRRGIRQHQQQIHRGNTPRCDDDGPAGIEIRCGILHGDRIRSRCNIIKGERGARIHCGSECTGEFATGIEADRGGIRNRLPVTGCQHNSCLPRQRCERKGDTGR